MDTALWNSSLGCLGMAVAMVMAGNSSLSLGQTLPGAGGSTSGYTITANAQWKAVDLKDMGVKPGTALDFSFLQDAPAGKHGFVQINGRGELVFADAPDKPVRFYMENANMVHFPYWSEEDTERFADGVARAGFNMFRPHGLDWVLSRETEPGTLNAERLARWDRLSAALKKRGIYLYVDLMTWGFYDPSSVWAADGATKYLKLRTNFDPAVSEQAARGITALVNHVNPHTGLALKDEPQMVFAQLRNEASLAFCLYTEQKGIKAYADPLHARFREFLRDRYGTDERLRAAWTVNGTCYLKEGQTLASVELPPFSGSTPDVRDMQRFVEAVDRETVRYFSEVARKAGVRVPLIDLNVCSSFRDSFAREGLAVVDNHSYHQHPSGYNQPGSTQTQDSSLGPEVPVPYLRWIAGTRQVGRPFVVSEVGHPYWSVSRHESGLAQGAMAALQGWQMLGPFSAAVTLRDNDKWRTPIGSFALGIDPPSRAGTHMLAMLYGRGDVAMSPHLVEVRADPETVYGKLDPAGGAPAAMTSLALVSRIGVRTPVTAESAPRAEVTPELSLTPRGTVALQATIGSVEALGGTEKGEEDLVPILRQKGVLPAGNRSDFKRGVYESDTGEVLFDAKARRMQIVTVRSEAGVLTTEQRGLSLAVLSAEADGTPCSVFLTSLDEKPLKQSERLLLVVATDAVNSGTSFADASRRVLQQVGTLPVLQRVVKLQVNVRSERGGSLRLWALTADGQRVEEIPVRRPAGVLEAVIDTATLAHGPATYFELAER